MKLLQFLAIILLMGFTANGQVSTCDGTRYASIGYTSDITTGVQFGSATTIGGNSQDLFMDIYEPAGDVATERPLIIVAFGGSFIQGTRQEMAFVCEYYTSLGYVTATIDYRLFDGPLFPLPDSVAMTEEVLMAVSDMRASVRYFKEDAATVNNYRIDTNYIFVGGISAGGIVASHVALLDSNDVIEPYIQPLLASNGGWTGNSSTNTQYTDDVRGVLNFSGALRKASYIDASDPAIFSVHDEADPVVPYAFGAASVASVPIITMEGSFLMNEQAQNVGVKTELLSFPGNGHVSYFQGSSAVTSEVFSVGASFLYDIICPQFADVESLVDWEGLNFYPNPTRGDVFVEWGDYTVNNIEIVAPTGQLLKTIYPSQNTETINLEAFDTGVYFVRLNSERGTHVESIQKL